MSDGTWGAVVVVVVFFGALGLLLGLRGCRWRRLDGPHERGKP